MPDSVLIFLQEEGLLRQQHFMHEQYNTMMFIFLACWQKNGSKNNG